MSPEADDNADALAALGQFPALIPLTVLIRRRKAVANAMANGLSVIEARPRARDAKAIDELTELCNAVFTIGRTANGNHYAGQTQ
jgi:cellulose biosynthesis protein BcsQ